ncbi:MAG: hypothetical protein ACM3X1_04050 [Ignavibacteriales bacterium]
MENHFTLNDNSQLTRGKKKESIIDPEKIRERFFNNKKLQTSPVKPHSPERGKLIVRRNASSPHI